MATSTSPKRKGIVAAVLLSAGVAILGPLSVGIANADPFCPPGAPCGPGGPGGPGFGGPPPPRF